MTNEGSEKLFSRELSRDLKPCEIPRDTIDYLLSLTKVHDRECALYVFFDKNTGMFVGRSTITVGEKRSVNPPVPAEYRSAHRILLHTHPEEIKGPDNRQYGLINYLEGFPSRSDAINFIKRRERDGIDGFGICKHNGEVIVLESFRGLKITEEFKKDIHEFYDEITGKGKQITAESFFGKLLNSNNGKVALSISLFNNWYRFSFSKSDKDLSKFRSVVSIKLFLNGINLRRYNKRRDIVIAVYTYFSIRDGDCSENALDSIRKSDPEAKIPWKTVVDIKRKLKRRAIEDARERLKMDRIFDEYVQKGDQREK